MYLVDLCNLLDIPNHYCIVVCSYSDMLVVPWLFCCLVSVDVKYSQTMFRPHKKNALYQIFPCIVQNIHYYWSQLYIQDTNKSIHIIFLDYYNTILLTNNLFS